MLQVCFQRPATTVSGSSLVCSLALLVLLGQSHSAGFAAEPGTGPSPLTVDFPMFDDPRTLTPDIEFFFPEELKPLWLKALRRPDSELQRMACDTLTLAHTRGMGGLEDIAPELAKLVVAPDTHPLVRRAAAATLVELNARDQIPSLVKCASEFGLDIQTVVEPALAKWGDKSLLTTWQQRLTDPLTPSGLQLLAIDGMGAIQAADARQPLLAIVLDGGRPFYLRMAAARAAVAVSKGDLLESAQTLFQSTKRQPGPDRLLGIRLLDAHQDEPAREWLRKLAADPEPSVAAAALARLFAIDPTLVLPLAAPAIANADANVRTWGARALLVKGDLDAINTLAPLLNDPNPALRRRVAHGLYDLAQKAELRGAVITVAETTLKGTNWRGLEQASLLVGALDQKSSAPLVVAILAHERAEVGEATGWALRKLAVPETLAPALVHAQAQAKRHFDTMTPEHVRSAIHPQLCQLFQFFGYAKHADADKLLRAFVPKAMMIDNTRCAAIWALGRIHEGKAVPDLADQFAERLSDIMSPPPEITVVRSMAAVALGRMKAQSALPVLRRFSQEVSEAGVASRHGVFMLTGEPVAPFPAPRIPVGGWFLSVVK